MTFIYPEMMKPETRTVSVRIELPNPDGQMKPGMYADVVFQAGDGEAAVTAVPDSAVIDSGTRQVVLVAKGEGRFEPRAVKLGRRGDGYTEVPEGLKPARRSSPRPPSSSTPRAISRPRCKASASRSAAMIASHHPLVGPQRLPGRCSPPSS